MTTYTLGPRDHVAELLDKVKQLDDVVTAYETHVCWEIIHTLLKHLMKLKGIAPPKGALKDPQDAASEILKSHCMYMPSTSHSEMLHLEDVAVSHQNDGDIVHETLA